MRRVLSSTTTNLHAGISSELLVKPNTRSLEKGQWKIGFDAGSECRARRHYPGRGLPDMDGIEAAREMMRAQPLPMVLNTSHHDAATTERTKEAGVIAYLLKPLRAEELSPTIGLAVTRYQDFFFLRQENSTLKENLAPRSAPRVC